MISNQTCAAYSFSFEIVSMISNCTPLSSIIIVQYVLFRCRVKLFHWNLFIYIMNGFNERRSRFSWLINVTDKFKSRWNIVDSDMSYTLTYHSEGAINYQKSTAVKYMSKLSPSISLLISWFYRKNSHIRAFAWHPHVAKFVVAWQVCLKWYKSV